MNLINTMALGQVGYCFDFGGVCLCIDPYLSNSVQEMEDHQMRRLMEAPKIRTEIDYILITHKHRDHCDIDTLLPLLEDSPNCRIIGPQDVVEYLLEEGVSGENTIVITTKKIDLDVDLSVWATPAAHPDIIVDSYGQWKSIGYVIQYKNKKVYHAGDTSLSKELLNFLRPHSPMYAAFLPVNERNYMREQQGVLGNMTIREAFYLAECIGVDKMIPTHWDMFACNQVYMEEINLLYDKISPNFELSIYPTHI